MHALQDTGFDIDQVLIDVHDLPLDHNELAMICTDDTIVIHTDENRARKRLFDPESSFERHNIPRRAGKKDCARFYHCHRLPSCE